MEVAPKCRNRDVDDGCVEDGHDRSGHEHDAHNQNLAVEARVTRVDHFRLCRNLRCHEN
jgi:hypothetical protein